MRREDLTSRLRQPYSQDLGFGVMHVPDPRYQNVWFIVPPPPPTEVPGNLPVGILGEAIRVIRRRPHWNDASELDKLTAYLFARREAVSSSRMEGTWSTIDNVLTPDEDDADKSDTQSVRGYAAALEEAYAEIQAHGVKAITTDLVCRLHQKVMSKDPRFGGIPGRIRTADMPGSIVQIGGGGRKEDAIYNPAPPDHVSRCLNQVISWMSDETFIEMGDAGMGMSLPIRMAIGHSHFEAVHPFTDGNGRVGRMLWSLQILASGHLPLYLSGYVEKYNDEYAHALQQAQKQLNYKDIIKYVCNAILLSHHEESSTKHALSSLPLTWRDRVKFRKGSTSERTLDILTCKPILTANILSEELGVSFHSASKALINLSENGILKERTGHKRNRVFAAEEVIALLSRPFAEDADLTLAKARGSW